MEAKRDEFLSLLRARGTQLDVAYALAARALSQEHYLTGMVGRVRGGTPIISPKLQRAANLVSDAAPDRMAAVATDAVEALMLQCVALHNAAPESQRSTLRVIANVLDALQDAVRRDDAAALTDAERWAKRVAHVRVKRPMLLTNLEPVPTAKSFAARLLEALSTELRIAVPLKYAGPAVEGEARFALHPVSRWVMADLLAVHLQAFFPEKPHDVLTDAIYARMPLFRAKGRAVDRGEKFKEEPFTEDLRRTIIAAFKAGGFPPKGADELFDSEKKADTAGILGHFQDVRGCGTTGKAPSK